MIINPFKNHASQFEIEQILAGIIPVEFCHDSVTQSSTNPTDRRKTASVWKTDISLWKSSKFSFFEIYLCVVKLF